MIITPIREVLVMLFIIVSLTPFILNMLAYDVDVYPRFSSLVHKLKEVCDPNNFVEDFDFTLLQGYSIIQIFGSEDPSYPCMDHLEELVQSGKFKSQYDEHTSCAGKYCLCLFERESNLPDNYIVTVSGIDERDFRKNRASACVNLDISEIKDHSMICVPINCPVPLPLVDSKSDETNVYLIDSINGLDTEFEMRYIQFSRPYAPYIVMFMTKTTS